MVDNDLSGHVVVRALIVLLMNIEKLCKAWCLKNIARNNKLGNYISSFPRGGPGIHSMCMWRIQASCTCKLYTVLRGLTMVVVPQALYQQLVVDALFPGKDTSKNKVDLNSDLGLEFLRIGMLRE